MLKVYKWRDYPWLFGWAQYNRRVRVRENDVTTTTEIGEIRSQAWIKKYGEPLEAGQRNIFFPRTSKRNPSLLTYFDFYNCELINLCWFKPHHLWYYATITIKLKHPFISFALKSTSNTIFLYPLNSTGLSTFDPWIPLWECNQIPTLNILCDPLPVLAMTE